MALRSIPVDAARLTPRAGGPATPVYQYVEKDGKRTRSEVQDTLDGVPLWAMNVLLVVDNSFETIRIKFPSSTEPDFDLSASLTIQGLDARVVGDNVYYSAHSVISAGVAKAG